MLPRTYGFGNGGVCQNEKLFFAVCFGGRFTMIRDETFPPERGSVRVGDV